MHDRPSSTLDRLADNPFYVLGLRPGCARAEVEREGQRLLSMLELGLSAAERYATPVGERERTPDKVRQAMAELRDPEKRLGHELWASLPPERRPAAESEATVNAASDARAEERLAPWPAALAALGWRRR